jgi:hypothetical protein
MIAVSPSRPQSAVHMPHRHAQHTPYFLVDALMFGLASAAILLRFPPDQYAFYPRCPIFTYFHLLCPGCGTTRALAALLHGQLLQAFHLNPLTTLLLPLALLYCAHHFWQKRRDPSGHAPHPPAYAIYSLLAIAMVFGIVRNLTNF